VGIPSKVGRFFANSLPEVDIINMSDFSPGSLSVIVLTFVLAGVVKGVTGMGLPTVSMGILGALMPPVAAASLLLIPSFVTNIWQLFTGPSFMALISRLWMMMLGIVVGTLAGARLLTSVNAKWTTIGLGVALAIYALVGLFARPLAVPPRAERWLSPIMGVLTGLVTGCTGVFVIPAVPYLQALRLSKDDLIQALGLSFTISTIALAVGLVEGGAFSFRNSATSAMAIIPSLLGMGLGTLIRKHISAISFRRWFLSFLVLLGLELVIRPLL
jgi:uncharacterized membrane protein YfcA